MLLKIKMAVDCNETIKYFHTDIKPDNDENKQHYCMWETRLPSRLK